MEFYHDVFGGTLALRTFGFFGTDDADIAGRIMLACSKPKTASPSRARTPHPGMQYNPGNNISVSLSGEDADELRGYWEKLCRGGTVTVPLEKQLWGDEYGSCADQFGINWMVNIAANPRE